MCYMVHRAVGIMGNSFVMLLSMSSACSIEEQGCLPQDYGQPSLFCLAKPEGMRGRSQAKIALKMALERSGRLVLTGGPGEGKSLLARTVAWELSAHKQLPPRELMK